MPAQTIYPIREFDGIALSIMPRPRAGEWLEDEIDAWRSAGLRTVLSLLEPAEVRELGLGAEPAVCRSREIERHASWFVPA